MVVGNINTKRDWGHARDFVEGMWKMLQGEHADDYILATNKNYSVREFIEKAFKVKGIDIKWSGTGLNEFGYDDKTNTKYVVISKKYFRPCEVDELLGDYSKAKMILGWTPTYTFEELVKEMVEQDEDYE